MSENGKIIITAAIANSWIFPEVKITKKLEIEENSQQPDLDIGKDNILIL